MNTPDAFHAHMLVVGSDDQPVGQIARIIGRFVELAAEPALRIPLAWVSRVESDRVRLDRTAAQARIAGMRAA